MTNEEMLRKLADGELPCEIIAGPHDDVLVLNRTHLTSGCQLCIIPQETLRVRADEPGFVQILNNEVVAQWEEDEIFWVLP